MRSLRLRSARRIEARIEAFNAFNWFRPGDPVTSFSSPNFGPLLPTANTPAGDPRIIQFAVKYQF